MWIVLRRILATVSLMVRYGQKLVESGPQYMHVYIRLVRVSLMVIDGEKLLAFRTIVQCLQVYTAGGGSRNPVWIRIRERKLGVPVVASTQVQAAYGSALLAHQGATKSLPRAV